MELKEAKLKAAAYCAYQERSPYEIKNKLDRLGLSNTQITEVLQFLEEENFLNTERFASAFARGKFRLKRWGKRKIQFQLRQKGIPEDTIDAALSGIEADDYENLIRDLTLKKLKDYHKKETLQRNQSVARYLIGKGFEAELVWKWINILAK